MNLLNGWFDMHTVIPIRVRIRTLLETLLPRSVFALISKVWRNTGAHFYDVQGLVDTYTQQFLKQYPRVVQGGPFAGMVYVDKAVGSNYLHKLIGSYEAILHPIIHEIALKKFQTVIDIGSAEGYYLAGLGRILPQANLIGFEIEESGRKLTRELCALNNVRNSLTLFGEATATNVANAVTSDTLVICDCEGAEFDILNPIEEERLFLVDMYVIELHDFIRPGIKEALLQRFAQTHTSRLIPFEMVDPTHFPFLANIADKNHRYELCRERGWQQQEWLVLERVV